MKILFYIILVIFISSCYSNTTQVIAYTHNFNRGNRTIENEFLKLGRAYYLNSKSVNVDLTINAKHEKVVDIEKAKLVNLFNLILEKNPEGKVLLENNVNLQVRIFNINGVKLVEFPLKEYSCKDLNKFCN